MLLKKAVDWNDLDVNANHHKDNADLFIKIIIWVVALFVALTFIIVCW